MDFFSKYDQTPVELVTFTEEIFNEKLCFLCSVEATREFLKSFR